MFIINTNTVPGSSRKPTARRDPVAPQFQGEQRWNTHPRRWGARGTGCWQTKIETFDKRKVDLLVLWLIFALQLSKVYVFEIVKPKP